MDCSVAVYDERLVRSLGSNAFVLGRYLEGPHLLHQHSFIALLLVHPQ